MSKDKKEIQDEIDRLESRRYANEREQSGYYTRKEMESDNASIQESIDRLKEDLDDE